MYSSSPLRFGPGLVSTFPEIISSCEMTAIIIEIMRTLLNTLERCTENKPEQRDNDAGKVDEAASCVCLGAGPVEEVRVEE